MKFKVTNTSTSSKKGAHAIFFTEVGRLLKPGEQLLCNRLEEDKFEKREKGYLSIEDGNWGKIGITTAQAATPVKVEESKEDSATSTSETSTEPVEPEKPAESKDEEEVSEPLAESTPEEEATAEVVETQTVEVEDERVESNGLEAVIAKESKSKSRRRGKNKNREEG